MAILLGLVTEGEKHEQPDQALESGRFSGQSGLHAGPSGKRPVAFDPKPTSAGISFCSREVGFGSIKMPGRVAHCCRRMRGVHMRRRELIIALGLAMAWPIAANAQPDCRALRSQILLMQAEGIADKLAQFIKEMQSQVGWTTQLPSTGGSIEQRRFDAVRLLRQAPAVTELSLLDAQGKEFYRVSRLALDVVGSGVDYSKEAKFTETVARKIYYGPVYLRRESEPYMTLGMAGTQPEASVV